MPKLTHTHVKKGGRVARTRGVEGKFFLELVFFRVGSKLEELLVSGL